jgi:hypothetical protein
MDFLNRLAHKFTDTDGEFAEIELTEKYRGTGKLSDLVGTSTDENKSPLATSFGTLEQK